MSFINDYLLTLMIFIPAIGAAVIALLPSSRPTAIKGVAVLSTLLPVLLAVQLWGRFNPDSAEPQLTTQVGWISSFNIEYFVGVDGISVTMVILTALICFLGIFASWDFEHWHVNRGMKGYFALYLLLEAGMMGVFCALDFFLFYVFWEVMLLPMFFLIGIWGGPRREYAAIKFFLYTLVGSVLMLVAILGLYFTTHTFDLVKLADLRGSFVTPEMEGWWRAAFVALFIGFAIKVPSFPFHTWLPDAHVEAPTPISVILASVLLKMGVYGILRVCYPILPQAAQWFAPMMMLLGTISIIYGGLCAMAQISGVPRINSATGERFVERDWKKLVAYSSVSHMGFCLIGLASFTPAGISGAIFQMWNHGIITGMLFLLIGVIYDRAHHRDIAGFGGLMAPMPNYAGFTALAFMASLGLPGLAGFISEVLCFIGGFQGQGPAGTVIFGVFPAETYYRWMTGFSVSGVVIGAAYFLWSYQKVFLGPVNPKYSALEDMTVRETFTLAPLAAITVVFGLYPTPILKLIEKSANALSGSFVPLMPWLKGMIS